MSSLSAKILYITLLLAVTASATQYVPIPSQPDGITFGSRNASVLFEVYYDLSCPDSWYSNDQLNLAFQNATLQAYLNDIQIRFHIYPLPYHYNAFYLAQVFRYVVDEFGQYAALDYIENTFANQSNYYNNLTATTTEIKQSIANDAAVFLASYNVTAEGVLDSFNNSDYAQEARDSWKFGAGNGVSGTPTFFANEVVINEGYNYDSNDWVDFFVSLFDPESEDQEYSEQ